MRAITRSTRYRHGRIRTGWRDRHDVPDAFELQVRTLFQHAYAEPQHNVGYKPSVQLTREEQRELAWIAASAWGADHQLERLRERVDDREQSGQ